MNVLYESMGDFDECNADNSSSDTNDGLYGSDMDKTTTDYSEAFPERSSIDIESELLSR